MAGSAVGVGCLGRLLLRWPSRLGWRRGRQASVPGRRAEPLSVGRIGGRVGPAGAVMRRLRAMGEFAGSCWAWSARCEGRRGCARRAVLRSAAASDASRETRCDSTGTTCRAGAAGLRLRVGPPTSLPSAAVSRETSGGRTPGAFVYAPSIGDSSESRIPESRPRQGYPSDTSVKRPGPATRFPPCPHHRPKSSSRARFCTPAPPSIRVSRPLPGPSPAPITRRAAPCSLAPSDRSRSPESGGWRHAEHRL